MKGASLKSVIARIVGGFRLSDSSYADDLVEWLAEGMGKLRTRYQLDITNRRVPVKDHKAFIPCGLMDLKAVESLSINGIPKRMRIREGLDERDLTTISQSEEKINDLFASNPISVEKVYIPSDQITEDGSVLPDGYYTEYRYVGYRALIPYTGQDITNAHTIYVSSPYYIRKLGYLQLSFEYGEILMHFSAIPVDDEGYPIIPDNENYKTALEWYGLACMIKAGLEHPLFDFDGCMEKFEKYGRRAINEITYPSVDKMESIYQSTVRFMMPLNYYETFFSDAHKNNKRLL